MIGRMLSFVLDIVFFLIALAPIIYGIFVLKQAKQERSFLDVLSFLVLIIFIFPIINLSVTSVVEQIKLRQVIDLSGQAPIRLVSLLGEPDLKEPNYWYYWGVTPWYSLWPLLQSDFDMDLVIHVGNDKIHGAFLAD